MPIAPMATIWYDTWGCLPAEPRMVRHMRMSASSLIRNYTSGKLLISWPRIVHIRLPRQVDPSSGAYIWKTRYRLMYVQSHIRTPRFTIGIVHPEGCTSACPGSHTSGHLALLSIRRAVHQLIKDQKLAFLEMLYHRVEYPAVWRSLFWWCLRGLCKKAVQRMHRK